jgi:sarcosine oxidase subunit beta
MRYSIFALVSNAFSGHRKWSGIIHQEKLKPAYDIVIVGAGGHGLATAHYLANNHDINDVLVLDAGWIGGGNTGKNTTIVRSDYLLNASFQLKNFALGLWRSLSRELDFNLMYSPRGYVDLAHSDAEMEHFTLRANSMRLRGGDANILTRDELAVRVPGINLSRGSRYPVSGALVQEAGGVVRHDAVSWGFARSASSAGIHIMQDCPLTGFKIKN